MADPTNDEIVEEEVDTSGSGPSYLDMSDEDMMKLPPPSLKPATEVVVEGGDEGKQEEVAKTDEGDEDGVSQAEKLADVAGKTDKTKVEDAVVVEPKDKTDKTETTKPKVETTTEAPVVDYKAEYERLLAPFKANGRDIAVKNVDDAVALMQMGANYNKKMAALKPSLKLMKMLENSGFLNEEKIGYLIDLGKNNPGAINKLVKDSGIDPMDLSAETAKTYKQSTYAVDDREIELDTVLDELQGSPTYTRTLDVVSNKWDVASKQEVSKTPQLLRVMNDHMASGIYDLISTEVENERMLGRLNGMSDIQAYRAVGDAIQARGGFNHLGKPQGQVVQPAAVIVQPKPKVEDDKLKDKRRAASSTKPAASTGTPADFNPLAMSDEEFSKMANKKFL